MRKISLVFGIFFLTIFLSLPAKAETIEDIKAMMGEMKADYEIRIKGLEAKIEALNSKQQEDSAKIEGIAIKHEEKVANIEQKIEAKALDVEYVGRGNAPVGKGGLVVRNPFGFGNVSVGGYADLEYGDFENTDASFTQHRWVINIGAFPHERVRFNSELEIEYGGPNVPNADGEVKVEQAYMDYLINDAINLRAGALLVPFGRYNLYHDSDLQNLTDRPIMARDIVPTTWTEAGAGILGGFNPVLGSYEDLNLNYELYVVNGLDAGFSDTGLAGGRASLKTDNNDDKAVVGRLSASPWLNQEVGVSGYWGEYDTAGTDLSGVGLDSLFTFGPVELINEYAYFGVDQGSADVANFFQGAYTQLNYDFWPKFLDNSFLGRGFKDPKLTLVGRYDWGLISDDSDASTGNNEEDRWTLGFNYRPIDNFVFKLEYQWNETTNEVLERGDNNGFLTSMAIGF
ncbi:MAG: OprO/OprP family phosphate-selective porin [Candidatus Omnitrophica bacterium]|nr:OprO/OprP family phosphate-selective porin [Candidatus Omnitrophota bacterium]